MVFSSHLFVFYFLPLALGLYYAVPRCAKHAVLAALSYIFYGWANPYFALLLFASTVIDYVCGLTIAGHIRQPIPRLEPGGRRNRRQKLALAVSVIAHLGLLGFFKYFNFGVDSYNALMQSLGFEEQVWDTFLRITLPLGISFYTFQAMSYSLDIYRGDAKAIRNFADFACYVSMFPQLVAGPIVRFHEVADQLEERRHSVEKFARGVTFFSLGMAKKVLIANGCGKVADVCFEAGALGVVDAWYGLFAYSFQIYFDFSAYSDMAIGLGLMLGFAFPKNFDSPYRADSIAEFWRRWHLSLSFFLRDYLYIVLGGNRRGNLRTYVNLATVMILGGLWHGAAWNFVIWGGIHGLGLMVERARGRRSLYYRAPRPIRIAFTFLLASLAWVFFRAADLPEAIAYFANLVGMGREQVGSGLVAGIVYQPCYLLGLVLAAALTWTAPQTWDFTHRLSPAKAVCCMLLLFISLAVMMTQSYNPFIYFVF